MKKVIIKNFIFLFFIIFIISFVYGIETNKIYSSNLKDGGCNNINLLGLKQACLCVLSTAGAGISFCKDNPDMPPCSVAVDVEGACKFVTGQNANDWVAAMLDRTLYVLGLRDEFYDILNFFYKGEREIESFSSKWDDFGKILKKLESGDRNVLSLGCENTGFNFFNCRVQNMVDPYCSYQNGKPMEKGEICYNDLINCHDIDKNFPDTCIIERKFECTDKYSHVLRCLSPKFDFELCKEQCNTKLDLNCNIVSYRETESCKRVDNLYDPKLNKLDFSNELGCAEIEELDLSLKSNFEFTYDPQDPEEFTNGYCVQQYWKSLMGYCTGDNRCYPLCYETDYDLCCPKMDDEGWTGIGNWVKKNTNPCDCTGIIKICKRFCNLEPVYECKSNSLQDNDDNNKKSSNGGSCPYVYSVQDENKVELEEDILVLKYSPNDELYYTKLNNYKKDIIIKEQLLERTYLDYVKILKTNDTAYITTKGNIVSFKNPEIVLCKNKLNEDCTKLLEFKDSSYFSPIKNIDLRIIEENNYGLKAYSTNLSNLNLSDNNDFFDYLIITLPKKEDYFKLLVSISMTPKIGIFEYKLSQSDLKGMISFLYKMLDKNNIVNSLVYSKLKNYGYVKVYALLNDNWVFVDDFVTFSQKDFVLEFKNISTDKIKVEFFSGMYSFDYICVDYSIDNISSSEIVYEAFYNNINVTQKLKDKDKDYLILDKNEEVRINFEEKIENSTYFLITNGYYQPGITKEYKGYYNETEIKLLFNLLFKKGEIEKYLFNILTS